MDKENHSYSKRIGARVFSEANDLKRTPEALAIDLNWELADIIKVISGEADTKMGSKLLFEMANHYPISLRDIWVEPDDTDNGELVVSGDQSAATARFFNRLNENGELTPYYEYRDTAMSRLAPYRPEWIRELRYVADSNPETPDVAFNNGHVLHQLTFFIGHVNFYWKIGNTKFSREMNTGDSALITPFVPHSFTSRSRDRKNQGLIIAVTYRGDVNRAAEDLSRLTIKDMNNLSGNLRKPTSVFAARMQRLLQSESLTVGDLISKLQEAGLSPSEAQMLASATHIPNQNGMDTLAKVLKINLSDLLVYTMTGEE